MQTQTASTETAQTHALTVFRGSLDLLCDALRSQGIPNAEIAQILCTQGSAVVRDDYPQIAHKISALTGSLLPRPRDL